MDIVMEQNVQKQWWMQTNRTSYTQSHIT